MEDKNKDLKYFNEEWNIPKEWKQLNPEYIIGYDPYKLEDASEMLNEFKLHIIKRDDIKHTR